MTENNETPAAPPAGGGDEELKLTPAALTERMRRDRAKFLRETFGTDDPSALKAKLEAAEKLEAEAEKQRKAQMSEAERLRAEAAEAKARAERAEEVAQKAAEDAYLAELAAGKGIKDVGLAKYRIREKLATMSDGETLDESVYLDELLKDERHRAAFGVPTAAPPAPPAPAGRKPAASGAGRPDDPTTRGANGEKPNFMEVPADDPALLAQKRHYGL